MSRIKTKFIGVYYRESSTNGKKDKTFYITYKNEENKTKELKIGKFSEGIRENYCHNKRNEILFKIKNGEAISPKKNTKVNFDVLVNSYLKTREDTQSKKKDESIINKHLKPFFDDYNMETIKEDLLQDFVEEKMNDDNITSSKTINNMLTVLSAIINYAVKKDLSKNVKIIDYIKENKLKSKDNSRERFLSVEECKMLYKKLQDEHEDQLLLFVKLALTTGARLNTILNIQKKDIDFNHNIISLKDFKNDSTYKGFLTDELKEMLFKWVEHDRPTQKIFACNETTIQKPLRQYLNKLFNDGLDKKDAKNRVVVHTLRHTFASLLAINGTPIFTIQKLMNHKDIKMTMRYAKLSPNSGANEVKNLGI